MIRYYIEKENIEKRWDEFIKSNPRANAFQMSLLFDFYLVTTEFRPYYCIAEDNRTKKIIGGFLFVIQRKGKHFPGNLFLRSLLIGGPLIPSKGEKVLDGLLKTYNNFAKNKVIYSEIRNLYSWSHHVDVFLKNGFKYESHLNYQISMANKDIFEAFSKSKKRQIKVAQKNGVQIINNPDIDQIHQFYKILVKLYKERIYKPLPDWSFFKSFQDNIVEKEAGKYLLVQYNDQIIGGIMLPFYKNKMVYEWYVAGLDRDFKKAYPSIMATWAGIKYANDHGYASFDFMGAGIPSQTYGVREFKSKFGGQLLNFGRFTNSHLWMIHFFIKLFIRLTAKRN